MNNNHKTIESLFAEVRNDITVPSRDVFASLFDRVTKNQNVRYTNNEVSYFYSWMHRVSHFRKTIIISMVTSIAVAIIVIIPIIVPVVNTSIEDGVVITEQDQELMLLDQEDVLVDQMVERYLGQISSVLEMN
jgi:hypothetical protein